MRTAALLAPILLPAARRQPDGTPPRVGTLVWERAADPAAE